MHSHTIVSSHCARSVHSLQHMETMVDRIEQLRKKLGISRRELSRRIDQSENYIQGLVRGQFDNPGHLVLEQIATELGTSAHYLRTGKQRPADDAYPNRTIMVAMLKGNKAPGGLVEAVGSMFFEDGDPPLSRWLEIVEQLKGQNELLLAILGQGREDPVAFGAPPPRSADDAKAEGLVDDGDPSKPRRGKRLPTKGGGPPDERPPNDR